MSDVPEYRTVRLIFSKKGRARYISHLDLNRTMTRVLRRAGIPLWYTEGFNRHPYITFAAPLSLGSESEYECMDFRLIDSRMDLQEVAKLINEAMPAGLSVVSAAVAVNKVNELAYAQYRLVGPCPAETVHAFCQSETLPVEKRSKKGTVKTIDLKPHLHHWEVERQNGETVWTVTLPCSSDMTVNPALLLTALSAFCEQEFSWNICRLQLQNKQEQPFA